MEVLDREEGLRFANLVEENRRRAIREAEIAERLTGRATANGITKRD